MADPATSKGVKMLQNHIALVKSQLAHFQSEIRRFGPDHPRYKPGQIFIYERLVRQHTDLLSFLESLVAQADRPISTPAPESLVSTTRSRPEGLSDLPEELLKELSTTTTKGPTDVLVTIIEERGGSATLDDILIDLYRKHGEVGKRTIVGNRLYRLRDRGLVWPVTGKKGVYTTHKPSGSAGKVVEFNRNE